MARLRNCALLLAAATWVQIACADTGRHSPREPRMPMAGDIVECRKALIEKSYCFADERLLTEGMQKIPQDFLFEQHFDFLPEDKYATPRRKLGDAYFIVNTEQQDIAWLQQHGYQPKHVDGESDKPRFFDRLPESIINHAFVRNVILRMSIMTSPMLKGPTMYGVIVGIRNFCDGNHAGSSTPFGVHQDGGNIIGVMLLERHNIIGGRTRFFSNTSKIGHDWFTHRQRLVAEHTMVNPFEATFFRDQRVFHDAQDFVRYDDRKALCTRDLMIIDLMEETQFKEYFALAPSAAEQSDVTSTRSTFRSQSRDLLARKRERDSPEAEAGIADGKGLGDVAGCGKSECENAPQRSPVDNVENENMNFCKLVAPFSTPLAQSVRDHGSHPPRNLRARDLLNLRTALVAAFSRDIRHCAGIRD